MNTMRLENNAASAAGSPAVPKQSIIFNTLTTLEHCDVLVDVSSVAAPHHLDFRRR